MSELYLVRHGQASFGADNYDQLSELGYEQSRRLGAYFSARNIQFDQFISGDLARQRQTLASINEGMGKNGEISSLIHSGFNEYQVDELFESFMARHSTDDEVRLVRENPMDKKAYFRLLRRVLLAWSEGEIEDIPESWDEFTARIHDARALVHDQAAQSKRVLVVSSGGAISQFTGTILGLIPERVFDLNLQMRNTAVNRYYFNTEKMGLSSFNSVPHLDDPKDVELVTYG